MLGHSADHLLLTDLDTVNLLLSLTPPAAAVSATLLKEMFQKAAKNPEVRKLAKAAAGKALKKGSATARKRAGDSELAVMAIDLAEGKASEALDKHLGSGTRMRYGGQGTQGVRLSGSGLRVAHAGRGHCGNGHWFG